MIECAKCGHRNADGTEFCQNCGTFLVTGESASWTFAEPGTLSLFPDKEGVATLRFRPPRSVDVAAGRKPFVIKVQSKASPEISARQEGVLDVAPVQEAGLAITPHTARGGESAIYRLLVQNKGNAPLQVTLDASDPDELLIFEFDRPALTLGRGEAANVQLLVRPRQTFYDGPPQPHAFTVQLQADGVGPVRADASLLQEAVPRPVRKKFPLVPVFLAMLAIVLLSGLVVEREPLMQLVGLKSSDKAIAPDTGASVRPSTRSTPSPSPSPTPSPTPVAQIPNVGCMNALAAQQAIEKAGFKFVGSFVSEAGYANGIVVKTEPVAGGTAPKGSDVTAFVSTGPPPGVNAINQCLLIIKQIPPDLLFKYRQIATPTPKP